MQGVQNYKHSDFSRTPAIILQGLLVNLVVNFILRGVLQKISIIISGGVLKRIACTQPRAQPAGIGKIIYYYVATHNQKMLKVYNVRLK